jgi:hypothetical protein
MLHGQLCDELRRIAAPAAAGCADRGELTTEPAGSIG